MTICASGLRAHSPLELGRGSSAKWVSIMGSSYGSVQKWEHHGIMGICIPSGKQPHNELENHHAINGTIHYLSTISMVIFNSYFDITRG